MTNEEKAVLNIKIFKLKYGVSISLSLSGKMQYVWSISTLCLHNTFCIMRRGKKCMVCHECYAAESAEYRKNLRICYGRNFDILTTKEIPSEEWPDLCGREIFRIESFGDVQNVLQVKNYINFANRNPQTRFVAWTKNLWIYTLAFKAYGKPENMRLIYSSPCLNKTSVCNNPFVDKIFTVWNDEQIANNNGVEINCGANACDSCRRCYEDNKERFINELLK